ncbi:MAG: bifunctional glutamate N-acetyltransferase/amino-acid acetyltransferase ArgJ [Rhodospirillales bacterium]
MATASPPVSPLAPARFPDLPAVAGVRLAAAAAGVKYQGRDDVLLCAFDPGTAVAGVLTRSKTASAPVEWCRRHLRGGEARALLVNSGNANAFTGRAGEGAVERSAAAVSQVLDCAHGQVFAASTGVIGEPLDDARIAAVMDDLKADLAPGGFEAAARAIMTTDTFPKGAGAQTEINGKAVNIAGVAKGSGMIAPDMATMLAFIFTDAAISAPALQAMLAPAADKTFNCVTVDGDTSTSDTVLAFATGAADTDSADAGADDPALAGFRAALEDVMRDLAQQIARDGEGASKFVEITVEGAETDEAARRIGLSIGNSPLVKTAVAGEDPNWGRIVMAVGKAGEKAERDKLAIDIGGHAVARAGERIADYDEALPAAHMKGREIALRVHVGVGEGRAVVWTCDLTHQYVSINADYRS